MKSLPAAIAIVLGLAHAAAGAVVVDERYCNAEGRSPSLRQTIIVVDGSLVAAEPDGPRVENRPWRRFVSQFLDVSDPLIRQRVDARERVTVVVANADGSGITPFFVGCAPLFRVQEEAALDAETSAFQRFFGSDWRRKLTKAAERFVDSAALAMVENVPLLPEGGAGEKAFRESGLVASMARTPLVSLDNGLPRFIIYTDLERYAFPSGEPAAVRATARADADRIGLRLAYSEVHVFGGGSDPDERVRHYLSAFVLASRGHLATLTSRDGAMAAIPTPRSVSCYQGGVDFPEAVHPVRLRLATDPAGTLVNSWIEMQSSVPKFVPVFGVLTCPAEGNCRFIGDNIFAQIWDDNPDPRPDLQSWQPFGGMRHLEFDLVDDRVAGRIKDELGYISGREDGLDFTLDRIDGARC